MVYRMAPVLVTLNDLEGHYPVAGLFKCNLSKIYAARYQISTDSISELALLWKKDYLKKTACVWLYDYNAAFVKLF